jgi:hypothetical protein
MKGDNERYERYESPSGRHSLKINQKKQFWNIVHEKNWTVDDVARNEANKRYALMTGSSIRERETIEHFLKILGIRHSQEEVVIDTGKLDEIGVMLCKYEKEIINGLGLRQSRRKGEWKIANTIDFIKVVLESWGCSKVETIENRYQKDKKRIREYSLQINKDNNLWNMLFNSNVNYGINLLIL